MTSNITGDGCPPGQRPLLQPLPEGHHSHCGQEGLRGYIGCPARCWNKCQLRVFSDILHTTILAFILEFFLAHTAEQNKDTNLSTQKTALGTNQFFFTDDAKNKTMP